MTNPTRQLLADQNFRSFWLAQVCIAGINGAVRFTFVWLVVTLTDWSAAEGLVAIALGVPTMLLALPAGAWSDRVDRRRLFQVWTMATVVVLAAFTAVIALGWATPARSAVAAVVIGLVITINPPNLNAVVPMLVPRDRLMTAIALQNGGMQASNFMAVVLAGVAIEVLGDWAGFGLLTVLAVAALVLMAPVEFPAVDPADTSEQEGLWQSIVAGLRYGFSTEPVRTMLILAIVLGSSFSVMQIAMPRVVEEVYERDAASAGVVLSAFGLGMLISSAYMANRTDVKHGRNVAIFVGVGLGLGQFVLSFAPNLWSAVAVMIGWGLGAGIAMTSHRTLLQHHTEPAMMGRMMGIMMVGFMGGLPVGAAISSVLAGPLGALNTMRTVGLVTIAVSMALTFRREIRELR